MQAGGSNLLTYKRALEDSVDNSEIFLRKQPIFERSDCPRKASKFSCRKSCNIGFHKQKQGLQVKQGRLVKRRGQYLRGQFS